MPSYPQVPLRARRKILQNMYSGVETLEFCYPSGDGLVASRVRLLRPHGL